MDVWIKRAGLAFVITAAAIVLVGLLLGREWKVEVRHHIAAPPAAIHPWIDDLRKWQAWAAWNASMDPDVRLRYEGPDHGVGATWAWDGPVMGHGRMRIVRSEVEGGVWIAEAIESETDNAEGSLTFEPDETGTTVVWRDRGKLPPVIGGFFRKTINEMLRTHFTTGLQRLGEVVQAQQMAQ